MRPRACLGVSRASLCVLFLALTILFLPAASGGYEVGWTSVTYQDPDRANRSVPTHIYYPADAAGEGVPLAEAPPDGFPVVVFGHGYLIPWDDYEYVWEGLAPEGYIVALPATETGLFPSHLELGLDLSFIARKLRSEGANPSSLFCGKVADVGAAAGHSMGGGASILAASGDATVTAVANLAAAETNPSAIAAAANIVAPALLFSGANDCVTPPDDHQVPMYGALASDCKARVTLTGASHCQFAEYNFTCSLGEGGCPSPTITRQEQHDLTLALLVPWLDYALKGDVWAWLEFEELLNTAPGVTHETSCEPTSVAGGESDWSTGSAAFALTPAFPNPFSRESTVLIALAAPARVRARVLTLSGRLVATLAPRSCEQGTSALTWDGHDRSGRRAAAGVYALEVEADGERQRTALVFLR